jgi:ribosome maturation factor RimP
MSGMMISTHFLEVIMKLENIKQKLLYLLENENLSIYSMEIKREFGQKFLEILIDGERMDSNRLEQIHVALVDMLEVDELDDDVGLMLSSVGCERPLPTKEDLVKAIGRYIYLETPKYKGNATLIDFDGEKLTIEINDKGRFKKISIMETEAKKRRFAVKF